MYLIKTSTDRVGKTMQCTRLKGGLNLNSAVNILQAFLMPPREDGKNACRCSDNTIHNKDDDDCELSLWFSSGTWYCCYHYEACKYVKTLICSNSFKITINKANSILIKINHRAKIQAHFQKHFTSTSFQGKRAFSRLLNVSFISILLLVFNLPLKINTFLTIKWYHIYNKFI